MFYVSNYPNKKKNKALKHYPMWENYEKNSQIGSFTISIEIRSNYRGKLELFLAQGHEGISEL